MQPERRERWGWVLFLLCAVIFLAMGIRDRDALLIAGRAAFLTGCAVVVDSPTPVTLGDEPVATLRR